MLSDNLIRTRSMSRSLEVVRVVWGRDRFVRGRSNIATHSDITKQSTQGRAWSSTWLVFAVLHRDGVEYHFRTCSQADGNG